MKTFIAAVAFIASLAPSVTAHHRFTALINTSPPVDWQYVRTYTANGDAPVTDVTSIAMRCNNAGVSVPNISLVTAPSTIGFMMDQPIYHPGVINVYMGKVPLPNPPNTAITWDGSGQNWFKVSQLSVITNGGSSITFPTTGLSQYTFTVPSTTPPGDYLVRIEFIALHAAGYFGGAQFHIACAQIRVTGPGGGNPGPLVSFPGAYTGNEPGILFNLYYPVPATYVQPGPAVWTG